jgi:hypothetical protein
MIQFGSAHVGRQRGILRVLEDFRITAFVHQFTSTLINEQGRNVSMQV